MSEAAPASVFKRNPVTKLLSNNEHAGKNKKRLTIKRNFFDREIYRFKARCFWQLSTSFADFLKPYCARERHWIKKTGCDRRRKKTRKEHKSEN